MTPKMDEALKTGDGVWRACRGVSMLQTCWVEEEEEEEEKEEFNELQ